MHLNHPKTIPYPHKPRQPRPHPDPLALSVEKSSSMKLVIGVKKTGDCWFKIFLQFFF